MAAAQADKKRLDQQAHLYNGAAPPAHLSQRYEQINQRISAAQAKQAQTQQAIQDWTFETIKATELQTAGLKTHICRLVAPDTQAGQPWAEVYIHAKLMIVDDTFLTLGSANINTRSMETDTELNIAIDRPEVSKPARQQLWDLHTKNALGKRLADMDLNMAFDKWGEIMEKNAAFQKNGNPPLAPLDMFMRWDPSRKNWD